MSEPVERYCCDYCATQDGTVPMLSDGHGQMAPEGEFVRWEDYAALLEKVRKIASEVIKERKSAEDWHARMSEDYDNGSALGQDVVAASEALQAWEKAEELLKDFKTQEGKPSV